MTIHLLPTPLIFADNSDALIIRELEISSVVFFVALELGKVQVTDPNTLPDWSLKTVPIEVTPSRNSPLSTE